MSNKHSQFGDIGTSRFELVLWAPSFMLVQMLQHKGTKVVFGRSFLWHRTNVEFKDFSVFEVFCGEDFLFDV